MLARNIVSLAKQACEEKQAADLVVLDLRRLNSIASYFLICSGRADRHVRAIAENVLETLAGKNVDSLHIEGKEDSKWILLDFGPVIVHVFYEETRKFYNLERLWGNAPRVSQGTAPLRSAATCPPRGSRDGTHGGASTTAEPPGQARGPADD